MKQDYTSNNIMVRLTVPGGGGFQYGMDGDAHRLA